MINLNKPYTRFNLSWAELQQLRAMYPYADIDELCEIINELEEDDSNYLTFSMIEDFIVPKLG